MTDRTPIYSGEAVLLNWNDAKSGRKIVLQLEKYAPGAHPFDGLDGERFAVVIVGPLAPAEHGQVARKGSKTVPIAQSESAAPPGAAEVDGSAPSRHAKPKRHCPMQTKNGDTICIDGKLWELTYSEMGPPDQRQPAGSCPHCHPAPKPKRHWRDMPPSQRAALVLKDAAFGDFVSAQPAWKTKGYDDAEEWLLAQCMVGRKRDLDGDMTAESVFNRIRDNFEAFKAARGHGVI